jgi:hypothetical protein
MFESAAVTLNMSEAVVVILAAVILLTVFAVCFFWLH